MIIQRDVFYETMKRINSPNLSYVEEIEGFKKSKAPINLFEIMRRLDALDIAELMIASENYDVAAFILCQYVAKMPGGSIVCVMDGFDCYLPYNERRDYVIKQFIKNRPTNPVLRSPQEVEQVWKHHNFVAIMKEIDQLQEIS